MLKRKRTLTRLLADEIKQPRKVEQAPYNLHYTLYMMSRVPEGKLKPLFEPAQCAAVRWQINEFKRLRPALRERGLRPDEDDDDAKALPARPAVPKQQGSRSEGGGADGTARFPSTLLSLDRQLTAGIIELRRRYRTSRETSP